MRHARPEDLDRLNALLDTLRALPGLKEKSRGVFYHGSQAFLHFHEDAGELFGDLRSGDDFERFPVTPAKLQKTFVAAVRTQLSTKR